MNYFELEDKYFEMFGDYFPSFILGPDEEKIQQCIDAGKDAYELFNLEEDVNFENYSKCLKKI